MILIQNINVLFFLKKRDQSNSRQLQEMNKYFGSISKCFSQYLDKAKYGVLQRKKLQKMGNDCVPEKKKMIDINPKLNLQPPTVPKSDENYGLYIDEEKKAISFKHAPLKNSQYLYHKFHYDNQKPEEINTRCQIVQVKKYRDTLNILIINANPVNIYVIVDGFLNKSITGLYVNIQKYTYAKKISIQNTSSNEASGKLHQVKLPKSCQKAKNIRVILESLADPAQTTLFINTYKILHNGLNFDTQEFQWNSLAFHLKYIYGQNQEKINGKNLENNLCVVCQEKEVVCIFVPCSHMCLCKDCMQKYKHSYQICPLCKVPYEKMVAYNQLNC